MFAGVDHFEPFWAILKYVLHVPIYLQAADGFGYHAGVDETPWSDGRLPRKLGFLDQRYARDLLLHSAGDELGQTEYRWGVNYE